MAASIELRRSVPVEDSTFRQAYEMKVETLNAVDMPEEIFVLQRGVAPARSGQETEPRDSFVSLADPIDLEEYGVDVPNLLDEIPYYRVKEVTLLFRNRVLLEEAWEIIQEDVQGLVDALNVPLDPPQTNDVTIS